MGRSAYQVDARLQVLVWMACVSAAYILTVPIYNGVKSMDAALHRLSTPPSADAYLVASTTMAVGHELAEEDLRWATTPGYEPPGGIHEPERVLGHVLRERVLEGDVIRVERLTDGRAGGITALIPQGYRAVSVHLRDRDRVSGFVEPGDRVDVLVTTADEDQTQTTTILSNVTVLSVDDHLAEVPLGMPAIKPQVMLLTTPVGANRLTHALRQGWPRLTLRPDADQGETTVPQLGAPEVSAAPRSRNARRSVAHAKTRRQSRSRIEARHLPSEQEAKAAVQRLLLREGLID